MSIDIFSQDESFFQAFADALSLEGMVVIRDVRLPQSFDPPMSDLVFLVSDGGIEIYMDARIVYCGDSALWRNIASHEPSPGNTRLIAEADPHTEAAIRLLRALLLDAGMTKQQAPQSARSHYTHPSQEEDDEIYSGRAHAAPLP